MTALMSLSDGRPPVGALRDDARVRRDGSSSRSSGSDRSTGPGRPPETWRRASPRMVATSAASVGSAAHFASPPMVADLVDLLECLVAPVRPLDLPHEREHRGRVLARCVDADREVGRADRSGPDARRRPAGQVPVGLGHERRSALVARRDHPDPDLVQGLEQTEEATRPAP